MNGFANLIVLQRFQWANDEHDMIWSERSHTLITKDFPEPVAESTIAVVALQ